MCLVCARPPCSDAEDASGSEAENEDTGATQVSAGGDRARSLPTVTPPDISEVNVDKLMVRCRVHTPTMLAPCGGGLFAGLGVSTSACCKRLCYARALNLTVTSAMVSVVRSWSSCVQHEIQVLEARRDSLKSSANLKAIAEYRKKEAEYKAKLEELEAVSAERDVARYPLLPPRPSTVMERTRTACLSVDLALPVRAFVCLALQEAPRAAAQEAVGRVHGCV